MWAMCNVRPFCGLYALLTGWECVKFNIPIILLSVVSLLGFGFTFSEAQFIGEN